MHGAVLSTHVCHMQMIFRSKSAGSQVAMNWRRVSQILEPFKESSFIVYVRSAGQARKWAQALQDQGFSVDYYHGDGKDGNKKKAGVETSIEKAEYVMLGLARESLTVACRREQKLHELQLHRDRVQTAWMDGKLQGVVATSAFGAGGPNTILPSWSPFTISSCRHRQTRCTLCASH